jgi:hypothetical protein
MVEKKLGIGIGRWSTSTSMPGPHNPLTTFRHEFAHHVHKVLLPNSPALRVFDRKWDDIWRSKGGSWFEKHVTEYSGTNIREAFAESFTAFTAKNYKKGTLPKELEDYFTQLFKGKVKVEKLVPVKKITLKKAAEKVPLATTQKNAIKYAAGTGKLTALRANKLAKFLGVEVKEVRELAQKFADDTAISVRRQLHNPQTASYKDIFKNGKFKNQFELGRSKGSSSGYLGPYKGSGRDRWEQKLSNGALQKNANYRRVSTGDDLPLGVAKERPIYGFVRDPKNLRSAEQYGDIEFVLHDKFKTNVTITAGNSSAIGSALEDLGTMENSSPALERFAEWVRNTRDREDSARYVRKILNGTETFGGWSGSYGGYVEAQVYGGIDLARGDVVKIILHPDAYRYGSGVSHIEALAKKYNIKIEKLAI